MLLGCDISNLQGPPSRYRRQAWYRNAAFVIVQAIVPPKPFPGWDHTDAVTGLHGYTGEQLSAAVEDGKRIGVYVWLWNSFSTSAATRADIAARLATIPASVRLDMRLWLDMEDTTQDHGPARQQDVVDALAVMDAWSAAHGLPPAGVYSGDWYLRGYMDAWFPPDRMYWLADYSQPPTLFPSRPLHQYTSTPIDSDAMLESEIVTITISKETTPMAIIVGAGMQAQMDAAGDSPLCGHTYHPEVDDQARLYEVEECQGSKGRYISSNSSGQWVNAGPL